jgi:lysylphosphatidylglycerol synthetase-like protein (DUF2156 family)
VDGVEQIDRMPTSQARLRRYVEAGGIVRALTRYVLPIAILLVGVGFIILGHGQYKSVFANTRSLESAMGVCFILIAFSVWMFNWMMRMTVESGYDRDREEDARDHFRRTGSWPDESA